MVECEDLENDKLVECLKSRILSLDSRVAELERTTNDCEVSTGNVENTCNIALKQVKDLQLVEH